VNVRDILAPLLALAAAASASAESNLRLPSGGLEAGFDGKSFTVGGRRVLLLSGAVHYFRLLPEEWQDRLLQTRLAGFNMVETAVPWNLHQPAKEVFQFEGNADLGRFLDLCHEMKLMVLVRIGPYVNAAVSNGGLPAWLGNDPRLLVRSTNDRYIEAVRAYWAKLLPIIAERQAPGGPVALVQLEDNYQGPDRRYLSRLYAEAQERGIRVPVVLSDLNPCKDFQRFRVPDNQVFATTELMPERPVSWSERARDFTGFADILFEGLAKGIDGYNHAMWAAGTHRVVLPGSSFPTRYEDGTCGLLEGGGLGTVFADAKRVNWFARTFESVLAQATALTTHPFLDQARRAGLVNYGRGAGTTALLFFKARTGTGQLSLVGEKGGPAAVLPVDPSETRHVVVNYPLTPKTTLAFSTAQVFAVQKMAGKHVIVVYAPVGSEPVMVFATPQRPTARVGGDALAWDEPQKRITLKWKCAQEGARTDYVFDADEPIHVVALEESQVARTWVLEGAGILVGAPGLGPWTTGQQMTVELRVPARRVRYALTFYPDGTQRSVGELKGISEARYDEKAGRIDCFLNLETTDPIAVFLRNWEMADATAEAAPGFDDSSWTDLLRPEPFGEERYGWYRCRVQASREGTRQLRFENVADSVTVYLNGEYVGQSATKLLKDGPRTFPHPASFDVALKRGENTVAALVKNWGRYRNTASYAVPLAATTGWGILGTVLLEGRPAGRWRQREGLAPTDRQLAWAPLKDVASPVRWYRTTFRLRSHPARLVPRVRLKGLSHGAIWLNGRFAGAYNQVRYDAGHGYVLPPSWLREENELIVLEDGGRKPNEPDIIYDGTATYLPLPLQFQ